MQCANTAERLRDVPERDDRLMLVHHSVERTGFRDPSTAVTARYKAQTPL
jgi:hypothetical protein